MEQASTTTEQDTITRTRSGLWQKILWSLGVGIVISMRMLGEIR